MSALGQQAVDVAPGLRRWATQGEGELRVARLPRPAWPIVAGAGARAPAGAGRSGLILAPAPDRFCDDLRAWLAGRPAAFVFAGGAGSFLVPPPAFDDSVGKRLGGLEP